MISKDQITFTIDDDVPEKLVGDPARIGGLIGKLIENSNQYNRGTWIRVDVENRKKSYSTDLVIRISDGGVGIDREQVEFMQEYLSGRGLKDERDEELDKAGLSLVGYHINAMSGKLEINSEPGRGTEFVITVPQLQAG